MDGVPAEDQMPFVSVVECPEAKLLERIAG